MTSNKRDQIKKNLYNILVSSTSHGIPNIIRTEKKRFKAMYLFFFIVCSSLCAYMMTKSALDYMKYDVVTEIDMIYETPTQFPTVTFFNLKNPTANYTLDDILINCHFNDDACDARDFIEKRDTFGYVSYQFNRKTNQSEPRQSTTPGKINGLQIELFSPVQDEMVLIDYVTARYFRFDGFHVVIHNHSSDPRYYGGISLDGCEISPGFSTNLILNRVFNYKLEKPFNNCFKNLTTVDSFDSDIFRFMIKSFEYSYRQKDCVDFCIGKEFIKQCKLDIDLMTYINIWENYKLNYTIIECIINVYNNLVNGRINDVCVPVCPLECDSISYETSTSFSKFPKQLYANELKTHPKIKSKFPPGHQITYDDLSKSMIAFNVFYNDLRYTKISQIPKTVMVDLISDMGGILGLFIGISFLSFGELVEMILEVIFILCKDRHRHKRLPMRTRV